MRACGRLFKPKLPESGNPLWIGWRVAGRPSSCASLSDQASGSKTPKIPHFHSTSEAKRSECVGLSAWVKPFCTLLMLLAIFKFYSCRFNWTRIYAASLRIILSVIFAENLFCVIHHNSPKYHISTAWAKRSGANAWASAHALSMVTWYHQNVVDLLIE